MNAVVKSPNGIRSWTDAQRAEQAAKLHARKIWLKSTGPRTPEGKAISRLNALTHGGTSRPAKAFMAHFRNYHALLRMSFQKKRELLQIQKNELIALKNKKPHSLTPKRLNPHINGLSDYFKICYSPNTYPPNRPHRD